MSFRKLFSLLSISFHFILFKLRVFGSNKLNIKIGVLLWHSKITVRGENNNILIAKTVNLKKTNIIIRGSNNKITISHRVKIYDSCEMLIEGNNCEIYIGEQTTLGSASIFCGESNTAIRIGDNCMLSRNIFINTSDFHSIIDLKCNKRINIPQNITIKSHVWIGFNARINKGASIAEHSVVATGAIVSGKTYPSNVILAGIPAKIIKEEITWSREKLPF